MPKENAAAIRRNLGYRSITNNICNLLRSKFRLGTPENSAQNRLFLIRSYRPRQRCTPARAREFPLKYKIVLRSHELLQQGVDLVEMNVGDEA